MDREREGVNALKKRVRIMFRSKGGKQQIVTALWELLCSRLSTEHLTFIVSPRAKEALSQFDRCEVAGKCHIQVISLQVLSYPTADSDR